MRDEVVGRMSAPEWSFGSKAVPAHSPEPPPMVGVRTGDNLLRMQRAAGNRAVGQVLLVQRGIDIMSPDSDDLTTMRTYAHTVVNKAGETFAEVVSATMSAFPAESRRLGVTPTVWGILYDEFLNDPDSPDNDHQRRLIRNGLRGVTTRVNMIHEAVRDEIRGILVAGFLGRVQKQIGSMPPVARSLSMDTSFDAVRARLDSFKRDRIKTDDLGTLRAATVDLKVGAEKLGSLTETRTRMGVEIETGDHLAIDLGYVERARAVANATLAAKGLLEFVIDDVKIVEDGVDGPIGDAQIEFRSRPLPRELFSRSSVNAMRMSIEGDIRSFPIRAFGGPSSDPVAALKNAKWEVDSKLEAIAGGLWNKAGKKTIEGKPIQHVTHSVPLDGFTRLSAGERDLLIPGTLNVNTVEKLLEFFLRARIMRAVEGDTIKITTTGRNGAEQNVKSGLDTIAGFLPRARFEKLVGGKTFGAAPRSARLGEQEGTIAPPVLHEGLPHFPAFNVHEGRAHLSMEEKLKPVLFDPDRKDIRVLVEHRGDRLVTAVRNAMLGRPNNLGAYLRILEKLDAKPTGPRTFDRWFRR